MNLLKLFGGNRSSKDVAKDRLRLILINDRSSLSPQVLESIRREILEVISKYVEIDSSEVEIALTKTDAEEGNLPALVANIPIRKAKER
ncbi:MAG: cell division topological specificity factor MinE [Clostridiales bacterium]|nr:cell division topological specificity factor MinE [Clostridiales bacterium]